MRSARRNYYFTKDGGDDPKDIIEAMLKGIDIILVDPALFPVIGRLLSDYIEDARANNDIKTVDKLKSFAEYISGEDERQAIDDLLDRPIPEVPVKIPVLSDEQVEQEVTQILETQNFRKYTEEELDLVVARLRQKAADFIAKGDYLEAERANHFTKIVISHGQLGTVEQIQRERVVTLATNIREAKNELARAKVKWEELYENMKTAARDEMTKMKADHTAEIQALENMKEYEPVHKYSVALLDLKRREDACVRNHDYTKAGELKEILERVQEEEEMAHRTRYLDDIDARIRNILKAQAKLVKVRREFWKNAEVTLINDASSEVTLAEKAIEHMERNLKVARSAKRIAAHLKEETTHSSVANNSKGLPTLDERSPQKKSTDFRQKQILNRRIYTRTAIAPNPRATSRNRPMGV